MGQNLTVTALLPPILHPPRSDLPVLLSVPHSGRDYPPWLIGMAARGRAALMVLEDPYVDRLIWRALRDGIPAVIARAPRAAVDCNRAEDEIDPTTIDGSRAGRVTARARGGLGVIPSRTQQHGYLWRRAITRTHFNDRLDQAHRPYHQAIAAQLGELVDRFGGAILIDCHSMPPPAEGVPPIVFGDCRGGSADAWVTSEAVKIAGNHGLSSGLNDPFAGGHVVERHGAPGRNVHAVQVEIDRRLYLDDRLASPGQGFDRIAHFLRDLAVGLGNAMLGRQFATAAE